MTGDRGRRAASSQRKAPSRPSFALTRARDPLSNLTIHQRRYLLFSEGVSPAEIAARENVRLSAVERSIESERVARAQFSQSALEHTVRQSAIASLPRAQSAILEALEATLVKVKQIGVDPETQEPQFEEIHLPDHKTRLLAIDRLSALIESVRAQTPMVSISNQNLQQNAILASGQVSIESIIREVRAEKGLVQAVEIEPEDVDNQPLPDTVDFELEQELVTEEPGAAEATAAAEAEPAEAPAAIILTPKITN